jgi:CelD/BcsL family acetyltransferase involved in cellulose biosynthesis
VRNQQTVWQFHWLTDWREIWQEGFVQQWQEWLDSSFSAHVFFHPALAKAWIETYLPLRDLHPCFLIAESADHTVFLPLVLWHRNWKNAFQWLLIPVGCPDYDYHDPIVVGVKFTFTVDSFWRQFEQELRKTSPVKFDRLALDGIRKSLAPSSINMGNNMNWTRSTVCPWIDLSKFKSPEEFLPSLRTSLRQDLRRQQRRISETGEIQFLVFTEATEVEAQQELSAFLIAHKRRWPMAYKAPHFHELLIKFGLPAKIVHFSTLRINGNALAWHLSFIYRDRIYSYMPAQEEAFGNLSPGKVLLLKCIEDSIARRLNVYDFLRGEESYKSIWTDKAESLWSFQLNRNYPISQIRNMAVDSAIPRLKTFLQSI